MTEEKSISAFEYELLRQRCMALQERVLYSGRDANLTSEERGILVSFGDNRYEEILSMTPEEIEKERQLLEAIRKGTVKKKQVKPKKSRIPHHVCVGEIRSGTNHAYGYCRTCGRVMKHIEVKKLVALSKLIQENMSPEEKRVIGLEQEEMNESIPV